MDDPQAHARFDELFSEMFCESDRGCILIGASALDDVLSIWLRRHLAKDSHVADRAAGPLFASMGPLSSFSAKIKLAYCLGLIHQWEFEDLERIRKIRNKAAHEFSAKAFTNSDIVQVTQQLKGADHAVTAMEKVPTSSGPRLRQAGHLPEAPVSKERMRFQLTAVYLAGTFHTRCDLGGRV